jgi:mono/diheme cytochrome c family protein
MPVVMRFLLLPLLAGAVFGDDLGAQAQAVLQKNCLICHGAALKSAKLDLRTRESMLTGGERGPALNPGHPEVSRLYLFAAGIEQPSMPPGKKLPPEELEILRLWIKAGAKLDTVVTADTDRQAAIAKLEERPILPEERAFWSFQPVKRPDAAGIDELWLAALKNKGLEPNPAADKRALIRRVYLDLIGLPPTPAQVQKFLADSSPAAFSKVVEELLASPHYGERWGRHWLDLVRYSDSAGYEFDRDRPTAHLYRDWVIQAFNRDLPYDEFLRLQLAGDLTGERDGIIAASYLRLGAEPNLKTEQTRMDELDDLLSTTGSAMLGMTIGCARCHNHKFDPIPQKDYYRMQAVFFSGRPADIPLVGPDEIARHQEALQGWNATVEPVRQRKAELEKPYRERLLAAKRDKLADYIKVALATPPEKRTEGQRLNAIQVEKTLRVEEKEVEAALSAEDRTHWNALKAELEALEKTKPILPTALGVEDKKIEPSYFLHHGSVDAKGSRMEPGVLSVAGDGEWNFAGRNRRAAFADWVASPKNPLTARVMVNRLWQHHFGEGIVRSASNFGKTGERPTHPELLDWLASEFIARGWSIKAMHRLMLNSRAYQMSSGDRADGLKTDPENRLLWRQARARLEGEVLRDSILAVAGTLDTKMGGPGIHPYIDPSLWAGSSGRTWPGKPNSDPETWRRSVYIFQKRTIQVPMMELFDAPNGIVSCARRNRSTIATQALILMNNDFVRDQAKRFAQRLRREAGADPAAQINLAFELALARPPSPQERAESLAFVEQGPDALTDFAQAIFSLNEFAYAP